MCVTGWLAGRARSHVPHHRQRWWISMSAPHGPVLATALISHQQQLLLRIRAVFRGKLLEPVANIGSYTSQRAPGTAKLTLRAWDKSFNHHVMPLLESMYSTVVRSPRVDIQSLSPANAPAGFPCCQTEGVWHAAHLHQSPGVSPPVPGTPECSRGSALMDSPGMGPARALQEYPKHPDSMALK